MDGFSEKKTTNISSIVCLVVQGFGPLVWETLLTQLDEKDHN